MILEHLKNALGVASLFGFVYVADMIVFGFGS